MEHPCSRPPAMAKHDSGLTCKSPEQNTHSRISGKHTECVSIGATGSQMTPIYGSIAGATALRYPGHFKSNIESVREAGHVGGQSRGGGGFIDRLPPERSSRRISTIELREGRTPPATHCNHCQADAGIGSGSAGTKVATETCGQLKPLKLNIKPGLLHGALTGGLRRTALDTRHVFPTRPGKMALRLDRPSPNGAGKKC
jgi:hypothetical protein